MSVGLCKKKTSTMPLGALLRVVVVYMMFVQSVQAEPEGSFIIMLNSLQRVLAGEGLPDGDTGGVGPSAKEYWISDVGPIVQSQCKACHQTGGTAANSGARLLFTDSAEDNHLAMQSFVSSAGGSADLVLSKITGGAGHGGGTVISSGSTQYQAFEQYFVLLDDGTAVGADDGGDFWEGLVMESPETTLRRASLLLAGRVASPDAIVRAEASEEALRGELIKLMRGDGFHDFLISGANDNLLTEGLTEPGFDFQLQLTRWPQWQNFYIELPEHGTAFHTDRRVFLNRFEAEQELRWAVQREPLELIAHVVETDLSYKKILTADYTMVNQFTNIAYRSNVDFGHPITDELGAYSKRETTRFKPGYNLGHVPFGDEHVVNEDGVVVSFGEYHEWPHAGVLSTQAWLARYPSTDTNRNRARARWTYYHFLGVDIEKSAPRTTDPDALADTNNPTMNNTACTVCHERMDPLAGAYQLFGDRGHFLDVHGGENSLPNSYRFFSGLFREGDTWYRDMRSPGFEGDRAPADEDSLQWVARQIADDPRFATASVKFWWHAIFGSAPLILPEDSAGPNYGQRLRAFNAQQALIAELAQEFMANGYSAKGLLADMILTPWYRTAGVNDQVVTEQRLIELETVGAGRLLTPEELDRKNKAIFGRSWRETPDWMVDRYHQKPTGLIGKDSKNTFYGGIDSAIVTKRNRQLTPLMSNVTQRMALEMACEIVMRDFSLPEAQRSVLNGLSDITSQSLVAEKSELLPGKVPDEFQKQTQPPIGFSFNSAYSAIRVSLENLTRDKKSGTDGGVSDAILHIEQIRLIKDNKIIKSILGKDIPEQTAFKADASRHEIREDGFVFYGSLLEFEVPLGSGEYEIEIQLATALIENNVNENLAVRISLYATDNFEETSSPALIKNTISQLITTMTNRPTDAEHLAGLYQAFTERSLEASALATRVGGSCEYMQVFPQLQTPEGSNSIADAVWATHDPQGVKSGWIAVLAMLLTDFWYTHD